MKIGILETGLLREQMATRFDPYPVMFAQFFAQVSDDFEFISYCVVGDEWPTSVQDCDGWLITGSRHGVYDDLPWIAPLEEFIGDLADAKKPLIGVCFGHQIIAQALGGEVVKSDRGWGVGLHRYTLDKPQQWMRRKPQQLGIYAFHQDQIVKCPPSAQVFLSSEFCPYAGLRYGDTIISVQAHPEFSEAYEHALIEVYGSSLLSADIATAAQASMQTGKTADAEILAQWFSDFFLSVSAIARPNPTGL